MNNNNFNSSRSKRPRLEENDASIEDQLESTKAENFELKRKLVIKDATISRLCTDNTELEMKLEVAKNKTSNNMEELIKEVEEKHQAELIETQKKMENERLELEDEIHQLKLVINAREAEIDELKELNSSGKDVKVELQTERNDLENEKSKYEAKINEIKSEINDLTQKIVEAEATHKLAIAKKDNEIKKLKQQCSTANAAKNELTKKNSVNETKMADFKTVIDTLKKKKTHFEAENIRMKSRVDGLTKKNSELEKAQQEAEKVAAENENKIQALIDEQQKTQDEYEKRIKQNAEEEEAKYRKIMAAMTADKQLAVETCEEYKKKGKELEVELKALKDETDLRFNELKEREDTANAMIEDQQKQIQDLEEQLKQANLQNDFNDDGADSEDCVILSDILPQSQASQLHQTLPDLSDDEITVVSQSINENGKRYLSLDEIHVGPEILYDLLDSRTIVNIDKLEAGDSKLWKLYSSETSESFETDLVEVFKSNGFKLNLTGTLVCIGDEQKHDRIQEIIQRIHVRNLKSLILSNQNITEYEFLKLVSSVKNVKFNNLSVKKKRGGKMRIDEILKALPNIEIFHHHFQTHSEIKNNTAKCLAELPQFRKLKKFIIANVTNAFEVDDFAEFIKKHPNVDFAINFYDYVEIRVDGRICRLIRRLNLPSNVKFFIGDRYVDPHCKKWNSAIAF